MSLIGYRDVPYPALLAERVPLPPFRAHSVASHFPVMIASVTGETSLMTLCEIDMFVSAIQFEGRLFTSLKVMGRTQPRLKKVNSIVAPGLVVHSAKPLPDANIPRDRHILAGSSASHCHRLTLLNGSTSTMDIHHPHAVPALSYSWRGMKRGTQPRQRLPQRCQDAAKVHC